MHGVRLLWPHYTCTASTMLPAKYETEYKCQGKRRNHIDYYYIVMRHYAVNWNHSSGRRKWLIEMLVKQWPACRIALGYIHNVCNSLGTREQHNLTKYSCQCHAMCCATSRYRCVGKSTFWLTRKSFAGLQKLQDSLKCPLRCINMRQVFCWMPQQFAVYGRHLQRS